MRTGEKARGGDTQRASATVLAKISASSPYGVKRNAGLFLVLVFHCFKLKNQKPRITHCSIRATINYLVAEDCIEKFVSGIYQ